MPSAGSNGSLRPSPSASRPNAAHVPGKNCEMPCAPIDETAFGSQFDSCSIWAARCGASKNAHIPAACRSHGTYCDCTDPAFTSSLVVPPPPVVVPPPELPTATGFHVCADEPLQVQSSICVPLVVARPVTSMHFPLVRP